jgi:hypothetical protein
MATTPCRRCLLREAAEMNTLELIREKIAALPAADRVDDALYQTRLEACKTCDHLLAGTCLKCGCYVEFRAAHRRMKCPNTRDRRW